MSLPDYLNGLTEDIIRLRMLERVPSDVDKAEGSFIWDSLSPVAFELYGASLWAQEVLRRGFASTTFGEYLDLRCEERGVARRPAVKATGQARVTGAAGTVVPAGTRLATPADAVTASPSIEFETMENGMVGELGSVIVPITAVDAGSSGNVPAGSINVLVDAVAGVTGVTNSSDTVGGAEAESDESLLARYLVKVRQPGTSGNKADYLQWALEVPGVGGALVQPLWNGPGTVKVYVVDTEKRAPGAAVVDAVQAYISPSPGLGEGKAPIGATVTVAAAVEVPINISVKLTLASGANLSDVRGAIESGVRAYLKQLAFAEPVVRYSRIAAILLDLPSIVDYSNLTVNGGENNVEMQVGQVAVLGTVSVNG
ncbi:Baseplate J family protein [Cohnella sp. CFH 77786]|uniref:baseplate J/gp47 family protein n=1 Tax=Cohnella sp. CFH 77786 TaxID=2662265 RepID=UPI001C60D3BA|nr:baseplate J/gp47 family protein [Cohnella sp. CFH 77786]MBW5447440.1 Baseplate J family protein [Cohnella sp. CFH 77786]